MLFGIIRRVNVAVGNWVDCHSVNQSGLFIARRRDAMFVLSFIVRGLNDSATAIEKRN